MNFLGIFLACGCIVCSMMLEGTSPVMMLELPAFLVVVGASFFACWVQFPLPQIIGAFKCMLWTLAPPRIGFESQVELLVGLSTTARQQGLLALENSISSASDDYTRDGIQMIVDFLQRHPELKVELAGHTDNVGNEKYNLQLSDDRANVVREALISNGIEASRLTAKGYGASKPIVPNDSDEHRAINRRTEMIIIN